MKNRRTLISIGVALAVVMPLPTVVLAQESVLEEIIVTGSYIRRDNFDLASPVTIITQEDISAEATPSLGEVLSNQTMNFGSDIRANGFARRYQEGNSTQANLRGLGSRATLQLIDGKRSVSSNLNNFLPQLAIARVEILKDGASALYGSDAVAGVVNVITRKNYNGNQFSLFRTEDSRGDHGEDVFEFIHGTDTDRGHFTVAFGFRDREALKQGDRPEYTFPRAFARSETGNPGAYSVPTRGADGLLTGTSSNMADPGCGIDNGPGGTDEAAYRNNISGQVKYNGQICQLFFGEWFNYVNDNKQASMWTNYQYEINDQFSFEGDFMFSKQNSHGRSSNSNPGGRVDLLPIVPGHHPGNPWRAMADRGAGLEPIYALAGADGLPLRDAAGVVQLAADPFDEAQGIGFNEDVVVANLRLFGKLGTQPQAGRNADGSHTAEHTFDDTNWRLSGALTWEIPNSSWIATFSSSFGKNERDSVGKNADLRAVQQGIIGTLGLTGDQWYNPFSTVAFQCVNRVCTNTGTPQFDNTVDVVNTIDVLYNTHSENTLFLADVIATGDVWELPAGTLQAAVGIKTRYVENINDQPALANQCNRWINGCGFDFKEDRTVNTAFFELSVPILDGSAIGNLELQLAGGYVDYNDVGSSFDPKIAFRYQPHEYVSVRASYSEAFIAPSLFRLFNPPFSFLQTVDDAIGDDLGTFVTTTNQGNPDLVPETADVWNVGFSVSLPLFGGDLTFGADYTEFAFVERITDTTAQNIIDDDFAAFTASGRSADNPDDIASWATGLSSPSLLRNPVSGSLIQIFVAPINSQAMDVTAIDFALGYQYGTDNWGDFRFNLNATKMDEYTYDISDTLKGDGVGKQNDTVGSVPPIPEWNIRATLGWSYGEHNVLLAARYTDEISMNGLSSGLNGLAAAGSFGTLAFIQHCAQPECYRNIVDAETLIDLTYSYTFRDLLGEGRSTRIELGARNLTDELPDIQYTLGGMDTFISDPRGRMVYFRINQDF
ncbi:MAG: TonB-dependent receptor [Proteobacteria bacterium]|nr:TonB-dependent receptor [Pseudomonadota bacterium]